MEIEMNELIINGRLDTMGVTVKANGLGFISPYRWTGVAVIHRLDGGRWYPTDILSLADASKIAADVVNALDF